MQKIEQNKTKPGFTIIEVVLVLAIAGLIFMMVFIALPALQRSQRDTQRRNDLARMQTAINNFQTNNRGRVPLTQPEWNALVTNYLLVGANADGDGGDLFHDPDGTPYRVILQENASADMTQTPVIFPNEHQIFVFRGSTCDGERLIDASGEQRVALQYKLEGGGIVCLNN